MLEQTVPSFAWYGPTRVLFGVGKLSELASVVNEVAGENARVFLVTGKTSLRERGILPQIVESLGQERITLFDDVTPYPSPELVDVALDTCRASSAEIVVAIGGGSAMDVAKAVAILAMHDGSAADYATGLKSFTERGLPFVAVPTTSGSSSEVTSGAALWDMEAKRVIPVSSPRMFPDVAIVDPNLAMTMPKSLAAATGMDAFTSAFEAYWSLEAEPIADALDLEAIRMFTGSLERSCIQGDLESRSTCALAATISGIAYSNSSPNVCHAVGSPLTIFWGVSHGQSVCISLPMFLEWNAPAIQHKLPALWDALGVRDLEGAKSRLNQVIERCGMETRLRGLGLDEGDIPTLVENIRWDKTDVTPRPLGREDVTKLLSDLL